MSTPEQMDAAREAQAKRDAALDAFEYSDFAMTPLCATISKRWPTPQALILELWMGRAHWNDIEVELKSMVAAEVDRRESDRLLRAPQD